MLRLLGSGVCNRTAPGRKPRACQRRKGQRGSPQTRTTITPCSNEKALRRHRYAVLSGKLLRMATAMQAFGRCHQ